MTAIVPPGGDAPVSITPLPVFEADADPSRRDAMTDEEILASRKPPDTIVVRFGSMKMVGEFRQDIGLRPGCGSRLVVRTHRGTEMSEVLTTTCPNSGCASSVSRKEILEFVEHSGGRDFPFHDEGRVLRLATPEDLTAHDAILTRRHDLLTRCRPMTGCTDPSARLVEVEEILGGEMAIGWYQSEKSLDTGALEAALAQRLGTRVEMHRIGARDEARLTADYERCGQHCCCKNFLKVLRPVSMQSAKRQKATLDPLKISGRCGRLMCCLRYEDQTYTSLKENLPARRSRVGTTFGPGVVVDAKILVQLVLVELERDGSQVAIPVEELVDPDACPPPLPDTEPAETPPPARPRHRRRGRRGGRRRGKT